MEKLQQSKDRSGFTDKQRELDEADRRFSASTSPNDAYKPLQMLSVAVLREYLAIEFKSVATLPFGSDFERLVDDVVFLCFFVGNDFLPHLPSLDIRDGGLDFLFNVYKRLLPSLGTYITSSGGDVNLSAVDVILSEVGAVEDYVFRMRNQQEEREKGRRER